MQKNQISAIRSCDKDPSPPKVPTLICLVFHCFIAPLLLRKLNFTTNWDFYCTIWLLRFDSFAKISNSKSPTLKNSVHEMSLSTKCLHPTAVMRVVDTLSPSIKLCLIESTHCRNFLVGLYFHHVPTMRMHTDSFECCIFGIDASISTSYLQQ